MLHARTNSPFVVVLILTILRHDPSAFNIDWRGARVFDDPMRVPGARGSYFGYSVALYADANSSLLLVGAPRANSSELPHVREPGVVYACRMNGMCKEWTIDRSRNDPYKEIKNDAWIGATIAVQNETQARVVVHCYSFSSTYFDCSRCIPYARSRFKLSLILNIL